MAIGSRLFIQSSSDLAEWLTYKWNRYQWHVSGLLSDVYTRTRESESNNQKPVTDNSGATMDQETQSVSGSNLGFYETREGFYSK
jgi:hypothetical protein